MAVTSKKVKFIKNCRVQTFNAYLISTQCTIGLHGKYPIVNLSR